MGKILLADAILIEDPSDSEREDDGIIYLSFKFLESGINHFEFCLFKIRVQHERQAVALA